MGRYGGAALFLCGGSVTDSTFIGNEADGLFGAVVNGDLSDDERTNASVALGSGVSGTYTCPALVIAGTVFEDNASGNGYGGAVASVDAGLLVFNSTMHGNVGGALYFGTGDDNGRDQLDVSSKVKLECCLAWGGGWLDGGGFDFPVFPFSASAVEAELFCVYRALMLLLCCHFVVSFDVVCFAG